MTQKFGENHIRSESFQKEILRNLSVTDFLNFGTMQIAFIKPIRIENRKAYALHGADGGVLSIMDTLEAAMVAGQYNDLELLSVH